MPSGLNNQPKLAKGTLVDIDPQSDPQLKVEFQFNPETIQRRRTISLQDPASRQGHEASAPAGQTLGEAQATVSTPETITMDIRLDATDRLERGDPTTVRYGVLPELSVLEMMSMPRPPSRFAAQLGLAADFGFGGQEATPVLVFVWGRYRVYAVRLTELTIHETEYSPDLNPTRVVASVTLQVLESANAYTQFAAAQRNTARQTMADDPTPVRSLINFG